MKKGGRWLIILAGIAVVAVLFLAGPNGLIRLVKMKQRQAELENRIVELQTEIELARQKLDKLSTDPEYLKKIAKEQLKMVDPYDTSDTDRSSQPAQDTLRKKEGD